MRVCCTAVRACTLCAGRLCAGTCAADCGRAGAAGAPRMHCASKLPCAQARFVRAGTALARVLRNAGALMLRARPGRAAPAMQ
eukprot:4401915-Alexandrium_andersonii.AAC.1